MLDICVELDCQPGDLIKRVNERELEELATRRARNALSRATATGDDPVWSQIMFTWSILETTEAGVIKKY